MPDVFELYVSIGQSSHTGSPAEFDSWITTWHGKCALLFQSPVCVCPTVLIRCRVFTALTSLTKDLQAWTLICGQRSQSFLSGEYSERFFLLVFSKYPNFYNSVLGIKSNMSEFKTAKFTITTTATEIHYNSRMKRKKKATSSQTSDVKWWVFFPDRRK